MNTNYALRVSEFTRALIDKILGAPCPDELFETFVDGYFLFDLNERDCLFLTANRFHKVCPDASFESDLQPIGKDWWTL